MKMKSIEPHEYLGRILMTPDGPVLPPDIVARLILELPDSVMPEFNRLMGPVVTDPDVYVFRVSEWLIRYYGLVLRPRQ